MRMVQFKDFYYKQVSHLCPLFSSFQHDALGAVANENVKHLLQSTRDVDNLHNGLNWTRNLFIISLTPSAFQLLQ